MKMFMDTEFTGLHQKTTLISLALIAEDGRSFYAEFTDYDKDQCDKWLNDNVLAHLTMKNECYVNENGSINMCNNTNFIVAELDDWLAEFDRIEIWSDHLAYDWVLFCELFRGAMSIPKNIYYIPFDICTLMLLKGVDPDINRIEYSGMEKTSKQHNAYVDALSIKRCYEKLTLKELVCHV